MTRRNLLTTLLLTIPLVGFAFPFENPVTVDDWKSGDAAFECAEAGGCGDFALKIDAWGEDGANMNGVYSDEDATSGAAANQITIYDSTAGTFSWTSQYPVCKVIVKGGTKANVYSYPDGSYGDTGLVAPINPNNGKNYDISHATFCWKDKQLCYQQETAWATGPRYVTRGNWATYTPYTGGTQTVNVFAGQTLLAGTATLAANPADSSKVNVTITLNQTFIFYYDLADPDLDNNVKVQAYASAPSGNPAPGLFANQATAAFGARSYTITVPKAGFYGIHLDVARVVPCL